MSNENTWELVIKEALRTVRMINSIRSGEAGDVVSIPGSEAN